MNAGRAKTYSYESHSSIVEVVRHRLLQPLVATVLITASLVVLGSSSGASSTPPAGYGEGSGFCASAVPGGYTLPEGGSPSSFDDVYACGPANDTSSQSNGYELPASGPYKGFFENEGWTY
jgi:hypothetical protein